LISRPLFLKPEVKLETADLEAIPGRDNFFLHGGSYPGSAGCIDVGKYDSMLFGGFNALKSHSGNISLKVRYE
jgi:hypothetical protein